MRKELLLTYEKGRKAVEDIKVCGDGCSIFLEKGRIPLAVTALLEQEYHLEDINILDTEEGFQGQYHFALWDDTGRVTLRSFAEHDDPVFPSIADICPAANWHERENMDFFGVTYDGHPNPAPLLLSEDMRDVHPLVKQSQKRVSLIEIIGGHAFARCKDEHPLCVCQTIPEAFPFDCTDGTSKTRNAEPPKPTNMRIEVEDGDYYTRNFERMDCDDRLILNMGPQHPSTHGVLRVVLELDGEYVTRAEPVLGYIHRMHEKMGEVQTWHQYLPNTGRIDYLHAIAWNQAYCMAVEKLMDLDVPRRAELLRIITAEFNRISSHLLWWGAYLLDLGAFTPIMYGFEDRERIMDLLQTLTGSRLTYCYHRFGGVSNDSPAGFVKKARRVVKTLRDRLPTFKNLVTDNVILRKRVEEIGIIDKDMCLRYGASGPVLRGAGIAHDVRQNAPYSIYNELDFEIPAYDGKDAFSRYLVRMDEMEESLNILDQALDMLPGAQDGILSHAAPNPGFHPPRGEAYANVESARGKVGVYVASDGGRNAYRVKLRAPCFSNLSLFAEAAQGTLLADAVSILGSLDLVIPEIDR